MVKINYIDITGIIETFPKMVNINNKSCCEFLIHSRAYVQSKEIQESFSIPVLLSRKNAQRILNKKNIRGKEINVKGSLSFSSYNKIYKGFYINVEKITGI